MENPSSVQEIIDQAKPQLVQLILDELRKGEGVLDSLIEQKLGPIGDVVAKLMLPEIEATIEREIEKALGNVGAIALSGQKDVVAEVEGIVARIAAFVRERLYSHLTSVAAAARSVSPMSTSSTS